MEKKVLVIDDEKDLVRAVDFRLRQAGYDVVVSYDGKDGIEKAKSEKPDLILLDLMLPKMDGRKVCGLLKKDVKYSKIPVIMFTASVNEDDVALCREMGADDYITKPFEPEVLLAKISKFLK